MAQRFNLVYLTLGTVLALSVFLPWFTVVGEQVRGIDTDGIIVLIAGIAVVAFGGVGHKARTSQFIVLLASAVCLVILVRFYSMPGMFIQPAPGIFLASLANTATLIVSGMAVWGSLKNTPTPSQNPSPPGADIPPSSPAETEG